MARYVAGCPISQIYSEPEYGQTQSCRVGYDNEYNKYNVAVISFSINNFTGTSEYFSIDLWGNFPVEDTKFRFALCTSIANISNYYNTSEVVSDSYQLNSGIFTTANRTASNPGNAITIDIYTHELKAQETYYLILWTYDIAEGFVYVQQNVANSGAVVYYFDSSIVYIDNGSSFNAYECYIDNGTSWDLYFPFIDNGTTWDICN